MLDVRDITVSFSSDSAGSVVVLDGVSLRVQPSEIVGLLGPSGSGKSTLLRVVAGLHRPDSGHVWLDGRDVTDVPTHRR
ncbi:MAG: ATP-binding cassette domain-containing protein, partial [Ilumatobacteraceae bacterium]